MYYKLGQLCFITYQGKRCYKLGQLHYYKLGKVLLQIGAAITNQGNLYYKIEQLLQIGAKLLQIDAGITNQGSYYKLGHKNHCLSEIRIEGEIFEDSKSFLHFFDPCFDDWLANSQNVDKPCIR